MIRDRKCACGHAFGTHTTNSNCVATDETTLGTRYCACKRFCEENATMSRYEDEATRTEKEARRTNVRRELKDALLKITSAISDLEPPQDQNVLLILREARDRLEEALRTVR